jgi:agmatine deiminase
MSGAESMDCRLAAEWEPHAATWLAWPHRRATWLGDFSLIPPVFARLARLIARFEPVKLIASAAALDEARRHLGGIAGVELIDIPTSDAWIRDTGPVFLASRNGAATAAVCWTWNAWGGKYPPWDDDAAIARAICRRLGMRVIEGGLVVEGGALETDGDGSLLVNQRCLVDPARNPGASRQHVDELLRERLGIDRVLWVGGELAGDDTDGHIDQLARFVAPGRVLAARQSDTGDPNHASLEANLKLLRSLEDAKGRRLEVIPIEIPPRFCFEGVQLPASHMNYYVANGVVVVPVFGGPTDEPALRTLEACFPDRSIEPFDATELVRGRGGVHCVTRDQPC